MMLNSGRSLSGLSRTLLTSAGLRSSPQRRNRDIIVTASLAVELLEGTRYGVVRCRTMFFLYFVSLSQIHPSQMLLMSCALVMRLQHYDGVP